jgi:hypothetical protein
MVKFDKEKLNELLNLLGSVPKIKEVTELSKRLLKEKEKIESKIIPIPEVPIEQKRIEANQKRSTFMKGVWDFTKLIYDNYPQLREQFTIRDLFSQYFARRRGEDVSISDVFWQNPSPSASLRP